MAEPEELDAPFDPVDYTMAQRRATLGNAFASIEDEPDRAARAQEISEITGTPPALVYGNLENHEKQLRAGLAARLLNNNQYLRKYLDGEPLAAKVSNDDYGQLDAVSKSVEDYLDVPGVGLVPTVAYGGEYLSQTAHVIADALKSLKEGPTQFKQIEADTLAYLINRGIPEAEAKMKAEQAGLSAYRGEAITNTLFAVPTIIASPVIAAFQTFISKPNEAATGFPAQTTDILAMSLLAAMGMVGARVRPKIGEPKSAVSSTADIIQFLKDVDTYSTGPKGGRSPIKALIPYIEDGKTPPPGVHPFTDAVHTEQAKTDAKNLSTAMSEVAKSATRERSPELFTNYLKGITDGEIGISADAVRALYGDKVPVPGEGPLGFIPDLAAQLERAEAVGGDIQVGLAEYFGHADPKVHKGLQDHIRARPDGMTLEEAKAPPSYESTSIDLYHGTTKEGINKLSPNFASNKYEQAVFFSDKAETASDYAAGEGGHVYKVSIDKNDLYKPSMTELDTFMLQGDYVKAALDKAKSIGKAGVHFDLQGTNVFALINVDKTLPYYDSLRGVRQSAALQGQVADRVILKAVDKATSQGDTTHHFEVGSREKTADLYLTEEKGGEHLYVDDISARGMSIEEAANTFGPRAMRDVLEQIKEQFPNAKTLSGERVSGAREKAGSSADQVAALLNGEPLKGKDSNRASIDLTKIKPRAKPPEPEAPGLVQRAKDAVLGKSEEAKAAEAKAAEERALFDKASSIGMTVDQYKRYQKLIEKQQAEDVAYYTKRADAEAKKKLSQEWKDAETEMRPQVAEEVNARPEIAADNYLRSGTLFGEQTTAVKLGEEYLTPEQRKALPPEFVAKDGAHPDDVASLVGYASGNEMVAGLAKLQADRAASGMNATNYRRRLIGAELERQVTARMSKRAGEVLAEAKDHVLSETQQQLLHEQTLRLAEEAGAEMPITKEDLAVGIKQVMDDSRLMDKAISSDAFLADAGRAGRAMETAHLKGDVREAFRQSQRQEHAFAFAREAAKLEAQRAKFDDKVVHTYTKSRDVPKNVDRNYTNYIRGLLSEAGYKVKLTPDELAREIEAGGYSSLRDFVDSENTYGMDIDVPEGFRAKPLNEMIVAEFQEFRETVESLDFGAKQAKKITVGDDVIEYTEWRDSAIEQLKKRPIRDAEQMEKGGSWLYGLEAPITRMEEMFSSFDYRQEMGPFFQAIVDQGAKSKAKAFDMLTDLSHKFKDIRKTEGLGKKWEKSLREEIPNDWIWDPYNETLFKLTRWNMIKMMQNMGTEGNFNALAQGIASAEIGGKIPNADHVLATRVRLEDFVNQHARKEDWVYVQKILDIFKPWQGEAATVYRNTSGKVLKEITPREIVTPFGTFEGGYLTLIKDPLRLVGKGGREAGPNTKGPLGQDYFRATIAAPHQKARTGATYFVDITNGPEQLAGRMQQMIHDISYRDFVINTSKIIYDPVVKNAISKYNGVEYANQMDPWLRRVAGEYNAPEVALGKWNDLLARFKLNLMVYALPLNYAVELSPSVGLMNLKTMIAFNTNRAANKALVAEHSKEIRHLMYNFDRDIREQMNRTVGQNTWTAFQLESMQTLLKPLTWLEEQFRSVTFYKEYMVQKEKGRTDYEAGTLADAKVRTEHGSSAVIDLPALMASKNEFVKTSTIFMGYFTTQRNWMRQGPDQLRQGDYSAFAKTMWGTLGTAAIFNAVLFTKRKEDDTLLSYLARAVLSTPLSMVPFVREGWSYYSEGFQPQSPLFSAMKATGKLIQDGVKAYQNKSVKAPIKDAAAVAGQTGGAPAGLQIGRTGQFAYDVATGKQRPRDIIEWMRGIFQGEAMLRK